MNKQREVQLCFQSTKRHGSSSENCFYYLFKLNNMWKCKTWIWCSCWSCKSPVMSDDWWLLSVWDDLMKWFHSFVINQWIVTDTELMETQTRCWFSLLGWRWGGAGNVSAWVAALWCKSIALTRESTFSIKNVFQVYVTIYFSRMCWKYQKWIRRAYCHICLLELKSKLRCLDSSNKQNPRYSTYHPQSFCICPQE